MDKNSRPRCTPRKQLEDVAQCFGISITTAKRKYGRSSKHKRRGGPKQIRKFRGQTFSHGKVVMSRTDLQQMLKAAYDKAIPVAIPFRFADDESPNGNRDYTFRIGKIDHEKYFAGVAMKDRP